MAEKIEVEFASDIADGIEKIDEAMKVINSSRCQHSPKAIYPRPSTTVYVCRFCGVVV